MQAEFDILALSRNLCRTGNAAMHPLYNAQPHTSR